MYKEITKSNSYYVQINQYLNSNYQRHNVIVCPSKNKPTLHHLYFMELPAQH